MEWPRTKQINCGGGGDDRFSDLPDEVVYDILCLLEMRDHARLMVVSKRCRALCISNPKLRLNNINVKKSSLSNCLNNFVDRLMDKRRLYGVKTESLELCWSFEGSVDEDQERRQVNTWLQELDGVEKFCLQFIHGCRLLLLPDQPLAMPLCNSTSFVSVDAGNAFLKLPSSPSYFATKLKILILNSVRIQKECNLGQLLSSFKSLKTLKLIEISGIKRMSISSSSNIEILSIRSTDRDHICDIQIQQLHKLYRLNLVLVGTTSTSLQISAPNLRKFHWEGYAVDNYYCITDSPHLLRASLSLRLPRKSRSWGNQAFTNCKYNLDKLLHSVRKCIRLYVMDRFVEVLVRLGCLPFSFDNVTSVNVGRTSSVAQVLPLSSLSSLLRGTTNVKHFKLYNTDCIRDSSIMSSGGELSFKMEYWQSQNLMCIHQLKLATVELFDRENEIELIKYLLTNAQELEEMVIRYTSPVLPSDFITELRKFKKPSTKLYLCAKSYDESDRKILIKDLYY